jgi:hypothetical protein
MKRDVKRGREGETFISIAKAIEQSSNILTLGCIPLHLNIIRPHFTTLRSPPQGDRGTHGRQLPSDRSEGNVRS